MTKFPDPVSLPDSVPHARVKRRRQIIFATGIGIGIRSLVIGLEFFGVYLYGSSALLLDAIASCADILTSLVLIVFIKLASRPPDKDHPFGHGRYEPLAGLQIGLLMLLVGAGMILQQAFRMGEVSSFTLDTRAWIIPLIATILLEGCYQFLIRSAKKQHSSALKAEAYHYRIDAITSLLATLALLSGVFLPNLSTLLDHFGAILIALFMVILGLTAARSNMHQLMDRMPDPNFFERVKRASMRVEGVLDTEKIRIQFYGPDAHVDIDVEVDPHMPVKEAHKISQHVRCEIQKEWPAVRDVTVHIEPFYPNDH